MKKLSAVMIRNALIIVLLGAMAAVILGFGYGLSIIRSTAQTVNQTVADAGASNNLTEALQRAQIQLNQGQDAIAKANAMFVTAGNYQSKTINDIQAYATATNVRVSDFSFTTLSGGTSPRFGVSVTLSSPVSYGDFIRFLNAVEGNVPKMQVVSVQLSRPSSPNATQVRVSNLVIGVFSR